LAKDRVNLTKQVKEANDIVAVIGSYLPLQPAGNGFKGLCPFHADSRPSLQVSSQYQNFRCWACGKLGDVFDFVMEFDKVNFKEAVALLARRAGISLADDPHARTRAKLLDAIRWAADLYHHCLLDSPLATEARKYLGSRQLTGETIRRYGLGFAPLDGNWLTEHASSAAGITFETLEQVGLLKRRDGNAGFYSPFRERVMFPIRDARGQVVGFGGRILPGSAHAQRGPKYYNSSETPLFSKSDLLYGLDTARHAAPSAGYLAVVEGYTDVLMAHQLGVGQVVATMGTALNVQHVQQLRRFAPRVVLVFDADAGGDLGVDRALEIFISQDVDLTIATLPNGLDPCDLLIAQGAEPFRAVLASAVDALDFKVNQLLARESGNGLDGQRRMIDAILGILALAPQRQRVKEELVLARLAKRLRLRIETLWARLDELRAERRSKEPPPVRVARPNEPRGASVAPPPYERELLEVLCGHAELVPQAMAAIRVDELVHEVGRTLLEALYELQTAGEPPDVDSLRERLAQPALIRKAIELREVGRLHPAPAAWLERIIAAFAEHKSLRAKQELQSQLDEVADHAAALEVLKRLQAESLLRNRPKSAEPPAA
jgi:DNA primase